MEINSQLDLVFERVVDLPPEKLWRAWSEPELLKQWFTPAPWKTVDCELDLRPGGIFRTTMRSPEGQEFPNVGSFLEVVPGQKLVWTNAFLPGFRPAVVAAGPGAFLFTVVLTLEVVDGGTRYRAVVLHANKEGRDQHDAMGFQQGWGLAFDQLVALVRGI